MNIDERLEALTQTVEIIAGMQKDNERRSLKPTGDWGHVLQAITQPGHIGGPVSSTGQYN